MTISSSHPGFSTGVKDPDKPTAREAPVKEYVRTKLEDEKEKKLIEDIVAKNNVQVPTDFTVPQVTDEQMLQMKQKQQMQQMQQPPPGADLDGPPAPGKPGPPAPKNPDAKKK